MDTTELISKLTELESLGKQVRAEKFERSQIKSYREKYVEAVQALAEHISTTKDKNLSNEAKNLLQFNVAYRRFQWYSGLMAAGISLAFVLIIYLYMMDEMNFMYAVSGIAAVGAFLAIRYAQRFTVSLAQEVERTGKVCRKLIRML